MPTESDSLVDDEGDEYLQFDKKATPAGKIPARQENWPNTLPVPGKLYTLYVMQWSSIPERIRRMSGAPVFLLGVLCTQKEMRVDVLYQEEVVQVWLSGGAGSIEAWLQAITNLDVALLDG